MSVCMCVLFPPSFAVKPKTIVKMCEMPLLQCTVGEEFTCLIHCLCPLRLLLRNTTDREAHTADVAHASER